VLRTQLCSTRNLASLPAPLGFDFLMCLIVLCQLSVLTHRCRLLYEGSEFCSPLRLGSSVSYCAAVFMKDRKQLLLKLMQQDTEVRFAVPRPLLTSYIMTTVRSALFVICLAVHIPLEQMGVVAKCWFELVCQLQSDIRREFRLVHTGTLLLVGSTGTGTVCVCVCVCVCVSVSITVCSN
jgi:hypothetical protein